MWDVFSSLHSGSVVRRVRLVVVDGTWSIMAQRGLEGSGIGGVRYRPMPLLRIRVGNAGYVCLSFPFSSQFVMVVKFG